MAIILSIIIPAKNEEKYLDRCLKSLNVSINRWRGEVEVILVNNGSVDSTREIAKARGCRVIDEANGNISKLRNLGAKCSKGNILAFLDADCLVSPEWISFCIQHFENPKIAMIGTRAVPDLRNATWVEKTWYRLVSGAERPDFVDWLGTSNLFVKKVIFFNIGGFNEYLQTAEDVEFSYRIKKKNLIYLEKRINTIHIRESKTLVELFRREYWRGKSSLHSLIENNFSLKELPSVITPALNLVAIMFFIISGIIGSPLAMISAMIIFSIPAIFMIKKRIKVNQLIEIFQVYIVAFVYIFARSCSLSTEVYKTLLSKIRYQYELER